MESVDQEFRQLKENYARMTKDDLGALAGEAYNLTEIAREALQAKISERGLDFQLKVTKEHEPRWGRSAFAFCTGKVPLRPIQRIGMLLLNAVPLLAGIFILGPLAVSMLKDTPRVALFLLLLPMVVVLAMARIVWTALTAPSQRDE